MKLRNGEIDMLTKRSRTKVVYMNSLVTLLGQIVQIILGFIIRKLFINSLGVIYLGYNSVFLNLLQMLNLADLGIGIAITSFLYKPLALGNQKQVAALMYMYKRIYQILGVVVLILGVFFSFFLQFLIKDASCNIWYLRLLFYLNLLGTVSTYYLAYKRTLLIADQKSYLITLIDSISYMFISLCQSIILLYFPNYIYYLILAVAKNIISNIIITIRYDAIYGKQMGGNDSELIDSYKPQIFAYIKDIFISRIGAYIYYSTDNIIISLFKGSLLTGYLSNYTLVIAQINNVIIQILSSIQATFGNYISLNDDINKQKLITDNYLCVNFCIGNFSMVCVMFLIQPFIHIVFGREFVLDFSTAIWLSINLLLTILIQIPSQIFTIYRLYRFDKPIIIISASLNIIISVLLVKKYGIDGVLIGTFITSLIYLFSRLFVICHYIYFTSYPIFLLKLFKYFCISFVTVIFEYLVVRNNSGFSFISFIIRAMFVIVIAIAVPAWCLVWTKEFTFLIDKLIPRQLNHKRLRRLISIFSLVITFVLILIGDTELSCLAGVGGGVFSNEGE